jgi:hypothetical protein
LGTFVEVLHNQRILVENPRAALHHEIIISPRRREVAI